MSEVDNKSSNNDSSENFAVGEEENGIRADHFIGKHFSYASRKQLSELFSTGKVLRGRKKLKKGDRLLVGQLICVLAPPPSPEDFRPIPEPGELSILFQDEYLVAINKGSDTPSHPLRATERGTLANRVVATFPECLEVGEDPREAGLAHRLDRHTTGVVLVARDQGSWQALRHAFGTASVQKKYWALVEGSPFGNFCQEALLQKGSRVVIDYSGLEAESEWDTMKRNENYSLLHVVAHTGRMHQIRAHLAHCGSPIAGDSLYGGSALEGITGYFLHAASIEFPHPATGKILKIEAPLPEARRRFLDKCFSE